MEPTTPRDVARAAGPLDGGGAAGAPAGALEAVGRALLAGLTAAVVAALLALLASLFALGAAAAAAHPEALRPALAALLRSLRLAALATALALPPALALGLWLARVAGASRLARAVRSALDVAATLPGVVFGLAGWIVVGASGLRDAPLAMALVLATLNLPLVSSLSERALRAVPAALEEASLALGASQSETIARVTLPLAARGLAGAALACLGRCLAECAPLLCVAPASAGAPLTVALWRAPTGSAEAAVSAALLAALAVATTAAARRLRR
jgi:ABC-type phosphate transport system permease subunit